jgi:hypothetical protein
MSEAGRAPRTFREITDNLKQLHDSRAEGGEVVAQELLAYMVARMSPELVLLKRAALGRGTVLYDYHA